MARGHDGMTCKDAIVQVLPKGTILTASVLFQKVKALGDWKDDTIWQHFMSLVVNLPPARHHWKTTQPILFLHPDGRYEMYDVEKHPQVKP